MNLSTPVHPGYVAVSEETQRNPVHFIPLAQLREDADKYGASVELPEAIEQERTVKLHGKTLQLVLLRPLGTENDILPVVIFYHGGGYVFGSKHFLGKLIRDICVKSHVAIVFPEISSAPEVKFPVIHEECYETLQWVLANGNDIAVDTSNLALCGDSSGGTLALAVSLMAKQRGLDAAKVIKTQIALYPATADNRDQYPSSQEFGNGEYPFTHEDIRRMKECYYHGSDGSGDKKWSAPLLASVEELSGLPPALIITAECDILRDEGEAYARKLSEAGVQTAAVRMIGAIHGFLTEYVFTPIYHQSLAAIKYQLDEAFGRL